MQRPGGSADGTDLAKKGIKGVGQGTASKKLDVDLKYEKLEKEGKLKSTPFVVPWSIEATNAIGKEKRDALKAERAAFEAKKAATGKVPIRSPFKTTSKTTPPPPPPAPEKKKLFGLF